MKALIPHKDILLKLTDLQKRYIKTWNSTHKESRLYPLYPLWAFSEDFPEKVSSACFTGIIMKNDESCFVLELTADGTTQYFTVDFASLKHGFFTEDYDKCEAEEEPFVPVNFIPEEDDKSDKDFVTLEDTIENDSIDENAEKKAPDFSDAFPVKMKSYRIGSAVYERNSFTLFNDKWYKTSSEDL